LSNYTSKRSDRNSLTLLDVRQAELRHVDRGARWIALRFGVTASSAITISRLAGIGGHER